MTKPSREELKDFFQSELFQEASASEDYDKIVDAFYVRFYNEDEKKSKPESDIMVIL
ncbi:hypothetical protein [Dyadobacter psychrotolerans]|uniref:hypothetical protein n=1 Tax=Dyadobacter psychrotolerans TaxID=2541721 RepID=UPI001404BF29|nr:hypothetical protein [Dyadobacter psychrotolerans]